MAKHLLWTLAALLLPLGVFGCSAVQKDSSVPVDRGFVDFSTGLPTDGQWKCNPAFGDVDGDGLLDLAAIIRKGDGAHVWLNRGGGEWQDASEGLRQAGSCGGGVAFGDIDGDGRLDLAVADHCRGIFIYTGDGEGKWHLISGGRFAVLPSNDLALEDFNADGSLDLCVCSSADAGVRMFFSDGRGGWSEASEAGFPANGSCSEIKAADFNGDGVPDVAATMMAKPQVWLSRGRARWENASEALPDLSWGGQYWGVDAADVNSDGHRDLVFGRVVGGPEIFLNDGNGNWTAAPAVRHEPVQSTWGVALGDFDADGRVDLVVSGKKDRTQLGNAYGVFFFRGDSHGGWRFVEDSGLPQEGLFQSWGIATADIDGDGIAELGGCFGIAATQEIPGFLKAAAPGETVTGRDFGPGGSVRVWKWGGTSAE